MASGPLKIILVPTHRKMTTDYRQDDKMAVGEISMLTLSLVSGLAGSGLSERK